MSETKIHTFYKLSDEDINEVKQKYNISDKTAELEKTIIQLKEQIQDMKKITEQQQSILNQLMKLYDLAIYTPSQNPHPSYPAQKKSPDTWTCPNCGKILPKYVGTCACGEVQPFDFDSEPEINKKKKDIKVTPIEQHSDTWTPLEQRSDIWTCTNCGKIMPKYVGTCACGQVQPFNFDSEPKINKKKKDIKVTPIEQRSDMWTCPNCGKIMPKYVGTCG